MSTLLFNQWDVVVYRDQIHYPHEEWTGLVVNAKRGHILWDNGNITTRYGASIILHTEKIEAIFDVEKVFGDALMDALKNQRLDNLTYIEILNKLKHHEQHSTTVP